MSARRAKARHRHHESPDVWFFSGTEAELVAMVCGELGMPESEVRDALRELGKKHLIEPAPELCGFLVNSPEIAWQLTLAERGELE